VVISLHSRFFFFQFSLFSFNLLLTVRILIFLGNVFEIKKCIFVISAVLGLSVLAFFWTVLGYLLCVILEKSILLSL
jgi:hypothetical protein